MKVLHLVVYNLDHTTGPYTEIDALPRESGCLRAAGGEDRRLLPARVQASPSR